MAFLFLDEKVEKKATLFVSPSEFIKQAEKERQQKKQQRKQADIHRKLGIEFSESRQTMSHEIPSTTAKNGAAERMPTLGWGFGNGEAIELDFDGPSLNLLFKQKETTAIAKVITII